MLCEEDDVSGLYKRDNGECVIQASGYHDGEYNRAKRTEGAIITVSKVKLPPK